MLLTLVLVVCVARAAPEWVEISQQHYRKPARSHAHPAAFYPASEEIDDEATFHLNDDRRKPSDVVSHTFDLNDDNGGPGDEVTHIFDLHDEKRKPNEDMFHTFHTHEKRKKLSGDKMSHSFHPNDKGKRPFDEVTHTLHSNVDRIKPSDDVIDTLHPNNKKKRPNYDDPTQIKQDHYENVGELKQTNSDRIYLNHSVLEHKWNIDLDNMNFDRNLKMKPNRKLKFNIENVEKTENEPEDVTTGYSNKVKNKEVYSATIERVANKGSVKRVQLSDTPVKSPSLTDAKSPIRGNVFKQHGSTITDNEYSTENISNVEEDGVSVDKINTNAVNKEHNKNNEESFKSEIQSIVKKNDKNNKLEEFDSELVTDKITPINNNLKRQKERPDHKTKSNGGNDINEEIKVSTMENIMKFVKVVADTISKNTKRGVNGKVKYLNELKETLLSSIRSHIDARWPDETGRGARRRSRSPRGRGHVEFPSSESSLMTISFLTFAVFLIKLVLQVIQTYKNKTMMVAPLVVATAGRTLPKLR